MFLQWLLIYTVLLVLSIGLAVIGWKIGTRLRIRKDARNQEISSKE